MWRVFCTGLLLGTVGCVSGPLGRSSISSAADPAIQLAAHTEAPAKSSVYVMSNGFHTGLILPTADIPQGVWPELKDVPQHPWVEVGWGSEIFYRAKSITAPVVFGAVLPNASVLHVVGWDLPPQETFAEGDLICLEVEPEQLKALCQHIHETYALDASGNAENLGPGIYGDSTFFRARGKYFFPNTCNVWTARGLKKAGFPIVPAVCGLADPVLNSIRSSGTTIRRR